jgi:hypothetical protein
MKRSMIELPFQLLRKKKTVQIALKETAFQTLNSKVIPLR